MNKNMWKKVYGPFTALLALFAVLMAMLCLAGCAGTWSVVEELDPTTGDVIRRTETSESIAKTVVDSTKSKLVLVSKQGWLGGIRAVPPGSSSDNPAGVLELMIGKDDTLLLTVPSAQVESPAVAEAVRQFADLVAAARASDLSLTATGVSAKSAVEK